MSFLGLPAQMYCAPPCEVGRTPINRRTSELWLVSLTGWFFFSLTLYTYRVPKKRLVDSFTFDVDGVFAEDNDEPAFPSAALLVRSGSKWVFWARKRAQSYM